MHFGYPIMPRSVRHSHAFHLNASVYNSEASHFYVRTDSLPELPDWAIFSSIVVENATYRRRITIPDPTQCKALATIKGVIHFTGPHIAPTAVKMTRRCRVEVSDRIYRRHGRSRESWRLSLIGRTERVSAIGCGVEG